MISIKHQFKTGALLIIAALIFLSACNKKVEQFTETAPVAPTGIALGETIAANPDYSLFYALIVKSGLLPVINNKTTTYSIFVPNNIAMKSFINVFLASLGQPPIPLSNDAAFAAVIAANLPADKAAGVVSYNIVPQSLPLANINATFPNLQYPTILNPAPALSALLRLTVFPTTRNGAWINNIPIAGPDINAANGVIHPSAFLVTPPQRYLWDRINTDTALTYFKAAIIRADSGVAPTSPLSLIGALNNIGANLTVFTPTDSALRAALTDAIDSGLVRLGYPQFLALPQAIAFADSPNVFANPILFSVLTAQKVKGIIVYHILGSRAFTNNFATTPTAAFTLLNSAIPTHPGVTLQAVFGTLYGAPFVISATVKGSANATASHLLINPAPTIPPQLLPEPFDNYDQHYLNGVLHKIDQVLFPFTL